MNNKITNITETINVISQNDLPLLNKNEKQPKNKQNTINKTPTTIAAIKSAKNPGELMLRMFAFIKPNIIRKKKDI
jgi:hypothetical protein